MFVLRAVATVCLICVVDGFEFGENLPKEAWDTTKLEEMMKTMSPEERERLLEMGRTMGKTIEGAKGGKGGAKPTKLTVKKARKMMRELSAELTSDDSKELFDALESEGKERQEKGALLAEPLVQRVLKKYGFNSAPKGERLKRAMQAAMDCGDEKGGYGGMDLQIRTYSEDIEEMLTGHVPSSRMGRIASLDPLAAKFLDMDEEERATALKKAGSTDGGTLYAATMRSIMKKGKDHLIDKVVELAQKGEQQENQMALTGMMNVLQEFLRESELKIIAGRLEAAKSSSGQEL